MGISRIESVTYVVDDLAECNRFFTDFGLSLREADEGHAVFQTLVGQTLILETVLPSYCPPPVETSPGLREIVWGVDSAGELERLVKEVGRDRPVTTTADGVAHFADESGFGAGLTLAAPPLTTTSAGPSVNAPDRVGRWNQPLAPIDQVLPLRICHVAMNIAKEGREQAVDFYLDRLGFRATDVVKPMGVFMQCEGDSDQHNLLLCHRPDRAGTNHVSFEVPGFDDVIEGGNHMIEKGWREARRLGRHTVGSNVFRFLHAPSGGRVELAADMDRVDDDYGTRIHEETPPHHIWTLQTNHDSAEGEH